jgi:thiamine-phosphate pyrophosphorylase
LVQPRLRGLYAVTPDMGDSAGLAAAVCEAIAGGAVAVQYRSKLPDVALRYAQAELLLAKCRDGGVPLIINDDLDLALRIGADGVHLGKDDVAPQVARSHDRQAFVVGVSCYNDLGLAMMAAQSGATYLAFGAAFPSRTKPGAVRAPISLFAQVKRRFSLPIAAIGGITITNAETLLDAGVDLLAVISDLFDARDIAARAGAYAALFHGSGPSVEASQSESGGGV